MSDNGIGMDKDEMENNLGTICRSGSLQFKQTLDKDKAADTDIIGQFGVGFYSAFMVADKVTVISKKYGSDEAYGSGSSGADGYTITECEGNGRHRRHHDAEGLTRTRTSEYLALPEDRLHALVKKYSDYIRYPIRMMMPEPRMKEETKGL